jgi:hypothetical protein
MHFSTHGLELFMAMPTDSLFEIEPAVSLLHADMMSIGSLVCICWMWSKGLFLQSHSMTPNFFVTISF